ncbi:hypothetical protein POM88_035577 [Heracleum sosnowskyi]|uniref:CCHC-type domain-containing protein n=1 Tax=Heracleum sosnowskyi TaxID=360622 RepID=A0AAD8HLM3_9APIA|nr:hypothetical protein POM88_035577 [Heracleum sosnowskyi]
MCGNVIGCSSAKEMWNKIELLCEGSEEVKDNQRQILISQYEAFMEKSGEDLTTMFERITAIREGRNLNNVSLETLYGVLKSYELEFFQKRAIQAGSRGKMANMYGALVAHVPRITQPSEGVQITQPDQVPSLKIEEVVDDDEKVVLQLTNVEDEDFYSIEEMENMDNPTMAYMAKKFKNIRFKRNKPYKSQGQTSRFSKGNSSKVEGGATRGGYKTRMVDRSKFRCYNCNELGHFATECRRPKQNQRMDKGSSGHFKKGQGKAYVAEGKCWDDSTDEEEDEYVNLALMAKSDEVSSSSPSQVPSLVLLEMSKEEYKQTVEELSAEMFNIHTSLTVANEEIARGSKVGIGFEYGRRPGKEIVNQDCSTDVSVKPHVLKKINKPIFKLSELEFDEEAMLIKQQLDDEDECVDSTTVGGKDTIKIPKIVTFPNNQIECSKDVFSNGKTETSKDTVKRVSKTVTSKPAIKTESVKGTVKESSAATSEHPVDTVTYKSKNRNGKLGNGNANVGSAPRKLCVIP